MLRQTNDLRSAALLLGSTSGSTVYPRSIIEGFQQGDVFTDGKAALFWHNCGFAFLCGQYDTGVLTELRERFFTAERRFLLLTEDADAAAFLRQDPQIETQERYFFRHDGAVPELPPLPDGFTVIRIHAALLQAIQGNITPRFSWTDDEAFLQHGTGFCVMYGDMPAAWAFSAAVSSVETDIGVETAPDFRRRGLAVIAAGAMLHNTLAQHKRPVWACHAGNTASARVAERLGFVRCGGCTALRLVPQL